MTVVLKLVGIKDGLKNCKGFSKEVLNADRRVAECRELLIKNVKEGRSEPVRPSKNEATINDLRKSRGLHSVKCLQAWPVYTGPCLRV